MTPSVAANMMALMLGIGLCAGVVLGWYLREREDDEDE